MRDYESQVNQYVNDVLEGRRLAGEMEIAAVQRYLADIENPEFYFDEASANYSISFFESMKLTQGEAAGKPFVLQPIQKFIVWNLFGWRMAATNLFRFTTALIQLARGSGKTPLGAGLILLAGGFHPDVPARANSYNAATKRDQAKIGFEDLKKFVESSDHLRDRCDIKEHKITVKHNGATFEYLSSDGRVADGLRIQALLKDEIHAWKNTQKEFDSKLDTGLGKFLQPLSIMITTAGCESSEMWIATDKMARAIVSRDNPVAVESMFVMICELDEDDDLYEIENYHKSSPLMAAGITKQKHIETMIEKAKINPDVKRDLQRFHANRRVVSGDKPFTDKIWALGGGRGPDRHRITPHAGVDLGWVDDLAAVAYVWRLPGELFVGEWDIYIPKGTKREINKEPWASWIRDGWITVTDSKWTDAEVIFRDVDRRTKEHGIRTMAFDPNNARQFALDCTNKLGIENYAFQQSHAKYNEPIKKFIEIVSEGRFFHGDNPVVAWCASNVIFSSNSAGHRMPDKSASDEKIDPIVATIMAVSETLFAEPPKVSKYETEDPVVFGVNEKGEFDPLEVLWDEEPFTW